MSNRKLCIILIFAIALFLLLQSTYIRSQDQAAEFFSSSLQAAHITETVRVDGIEYTVVDGRILSEGAPLQISRYRILRTAYALALARRDPLLTIAGTDPDALAQKSRDLAQVQDTLAEAQTSPRDAFFVRSALYPTRFLSALASLERARLAFIASGSDTDATAYALVLQEALAAGKYDISNFRTAFEKEAGSDEIKFPTLGGTISRSSMVASVATTMDRFSELDALVTARRRCLAGNISFCDKADVVLASPPATEFPTVGSRAPLKEDLGLGLSTDIHLLLKRSVCTGMTPGPYSFTYGDPADRGRMPLWYTGNLYFAPTKGEHATMDYMRSEFQMDYSIVNPIEFYICPDVLTDIGTSYALLSTLRFAQAYPEYAARERATLISQPEIRSRDAFVYMQQVLREITADELPESAVVGDFETIVNMWRTRSAGLDTLVGQIVEVDRRDVDLHEQGIAFDVSAHMLFLTHSAFPSLFLTQNPSVGSSTLPLRFMNDTDYKALEPHMIPYTELIKSVSREKILHDINAYLSFEGIK